MREIVKQHKEDSFLLKEIEERFEEEWFRKEKNLEEEKEMKLEFDFIDDYSLDPIQCEVRAGLARNKLN